ncbi:hypothetical protein AOX56_00335 [Aeromonas sobria]|jgi:hypothetical protein|uniref:DNA endonuclease I-HmuI-like NUMOD-like domain-containing protein n=1 Tax=Aeromonas sobria TaxID=646 RepID=A0A2N3J8V6_AERSO|nr:hypothetical protein AOX56_00335 [Aeromonas sobria]
MSLIQQIAEWVHARSGGAISAEVAAEFSLTVSKASIAMGQILKETRFTARTEHFCLVGDNGKGRHTRRLYVDVVKPPQWRKTPVIGTAGDQVVRFPSITEAETQGGFVRVSITRCLAGQQKKHGGYSWQIDTTKGSTSCTAITTP